MRDEIDRVLREAEAALASPQLLLVTTEIVVYGRDPAVDRATVIERYPDLAVLIDPVSGDRLLRSPDCAAGFDGEVELLRRWDDERPAGARSAIVNLELSTHRAAEPALFDEASLILISGGSRAGKTTAAAQRLVREWIQRGGDGRLFWVLGPSVDACWVSFSKLFLGHDGRAPILPRDDLGPRLLRRWPDHKDKKNLTAVAVDGSLIELKPITRTDGSQVRGEAVEAALLEEVTSLKHAEGFAEAQARIASTRGVLVASTTPLPPHWIEQTIKAAAQEEREREETGAARSIVHYEISRFANPWISAADTLADYKRMEATAGKSTAERHINGRWQLSDDGRFWLGWNADDSTIPPREQQDLDGLRLDGEPLIDVTARVVKMYLGTGNPFVAGLRASNLDYLCGLDVNQRPISLMCAKIWATRATIDQPSKWGIAIVGEVSRSYCATLHEFGDYAKAAARGRFAGSLVFVDPQNCHSDRSIREGKSGYRGGNESARGLALAGFDVRPASTRAAARTDLSTIPTRVPWSPPRGDSHSLMRRLQHERRFLVSSQCPRLLYALERQEVDGNNPDQPRKAPNTASDRDSNAIDGVRYLCWRLWGPGDGIRLV